MGRTAAASRSASRAALFGLLAATVSSPGRADETQTSIGEVPVCDLGSATYEGVPGGLHPGGTSLRPAGHEAAGLAIAERDIVPRDDSGAPSADGKIVLISVGVSHTTMMFAVDGPNSFKPRADADPARNPRLVIVDGAWDGHPTPQWLGHAPPWGGRDPWASVRTATAIR